MEIILFLSFLIFMGSDSFLFWEEYIFKKGLVKIKGKVVGFSKGKSKENKKTIYTVVEFNHPSGQRGWLESHKPINTLRFKIGREVPLITDVNDFYITRGTNSLSNEWAAIFLSFAVANLYFLLDVWQPIFKGTVLLTLAFSVFAYFIAKEVWRMHDQDFKITSAWREWRLQIVKNRVYKDCEAEKIQFWDKEYCLKFFKRCNRHKTAYFAFGSIFTAAILFMGLKAYIETEQFYSETKKATVTIVQVSSSGKPVYEYYDIEGIPHRIVSRHELGSKKLGDSFNVLYHPYYQQLWFDDNQFIHYETVFYIGFALLMGLEFLVLYSLMPRFDLNSLPATSSEELIIKKAS